MRVTVRQSLNDLLKFDAKNEVAPTSNSRSGLTQKISPEAEGMSPLLVSWMFRVINTLHEKLLSSYMFVIGQT